MNHEKITLEAEIPVADAGERLDRVLARLFPEYSRSRLQQWIKNGDVTIAGKTCKKIRSSFAGGETVVVDAEIESAGDWQPQSIPLQIVFQDEQLIIINKQAGLVVHPGVGNRDKTLVNGLLHQFPELEHLPRAGIVHRLDKDTTGLLVVARNLSSHNHLVSQLQQRTFAREYQAVVEGLMIVGGTLDKPLGRHPSQRIKMAVVEGGKTAITHYRVVKTYRAHSLLTVKLETGRTHQIRVHMSYLRHPLVGDQLYRGRLKLPAGASEELIDSLKHFKRQALHARKLGLQHPETGEWVEWEAELPDDFQQLLDVLENDNNS